MIFDWSSEKDLILQEQRNISFAQVILEIERENFRLISPHPNKEKYPNQVLFLVLIDEYVYVVPAVPLEYEAYFLKTIYPSRNYTKAYQEGRLMI